jgi:hypothetical protein
MCRLTYLPQDGVADKINWDVERGAVACPWRGLRKVSTWMSRSWGRPDDRSRIVGTAHDRSACRFCRGRIDVIYLAIKLDGDGLALAEELVKFRLLRTRELEVGIG